MNPNAELPTGVIPAFIAELARTISIVAIIQGLLCTISPANAQDSALTANKRNDSMINTFQVMCMLEPFNFERLSARASAMKMQLQPDQGNRIPGAPVTQRKAWSGQLSTGGFGLLIDMMPGQPNKGGSCAITGGVPNVDKFRADVINTLKLADAPQPNLVNRLRTYVWQNTHGPGSAIVLADLSPQGQSALMLQAIDAGK